MIIFSILQMFSMQEDKDCRESNEALEYIVPFSGISRREKVWYCYPTITTCSNYNNYFNNVLITKYPNITNVLLCTYLVVATHCSVSI